MGSSLGAENRRLCGQGAFKCRGADALLAAVGGERFNNNVGAAHLGAVLTHATLSPRLDKSIFTAVTS